jgi:hypothetical protein
VLDDAMRQAREGFLLEQAARDGSVGEVASAVLDAERPCATRDTADEPSEEGWCDPSCQATPYEDACASVEATLSQWPDWTCDTVARTAEGLPPAAFCKALYSHPAPAGSVPSPYAVEDLPTERIVVRTAFVHEGRLHVSDYPAPDLNLYTPPNAPALAECKALTEQNACVHQCDVQNGRYQDPCACSEGEGDAHEHHEHEEEEGEETDESPEVREARLAAEAAAAELAEAQARTEEAEQELRYQQCLSLCRFGEAEPEAPQEGEEGEPPPPSPVRVSELARLEATPAPGLFVVTVDTRQHAADGQVLTQGASTLVLKDPGLVALWEGKALPREDALGALEVVFDFNEVLREEDKVSLAPLPGMNEPALVGLGDGGKLVAFGFHSQKGEEPVVKLEQDAVCAALRAEPQRFPQAYLEACPPQQAAPDAGGGEADAGAKGTVAGEVTP